MLTEAVQPAGWMWRGVVTWDKRSVRPMFGCFRQQCEYIVNPASKVLFTSKPVALIADLLAVTHKDVIVLDPFMGGASVGEAALTTGRGHIGIELSLEYFHISEERLRGVMKSGSLPIAANIGVRAQC